MSAAGGLATGFAPSFRLIQAHFWMGLAGLCLFAVGLVAVAPGLEGHFFQPRLLGLVHLGVLGWLLPIALGAMHQLVPVVFEAPIRSERLAWCALALYAAGTAGLVGHLWQFSLGWGLPAAAVLLCAGLILYAANLLGTLGRAGTPSLTGGYIVASLGWLLVTATFGLLLALHLHAPFLQSNHLDWLRAHAHAGVLGFFGLLIMGVAFRLLEMFLLSHGARQGPGRAALVLVNGGLVALVVASVGGSAGWLAGAAISIALGVACFLEQVRRIWRLRMRRKADPAWQLTFVSFGWLAVATAMGVVLVFREGPPFELGLAYGVVAIPGFVGSVVIGQLYKILPFLVWLHRYSPLVGLKRIPSASEILADRPKQVQAILLHVGLLVLLAGIAFESAPVRIVGAVSFAASALLATRNFTVILRSRP